MLTPATSCQPCVSLRLVQFTGHDLLPVEISDPAKANPENVNRGIVVGRAVVRVAVEVFAGTHGYGEKVDSRIPLRVVAWRFMGHQHITSLSRPIIETVALATVIWVSNVWVRSRGKCALVVTLLAGSLTR